MECEICGDLSTGKHYGAYACESCRLFFKRSARKQVHYSCKVMSGLCRINKQCRNMCQYCRMKRCIAVGMREDAPLHYKNTERHPKVHHFPELNYHRVCHDERFQDMVEKNKSDIFSRIKALDYSGSYEPTENHIEIASRWLFMSIKWAKSLPYFAELYYPDQLELLRQNWNKLFLFNLMYFEIVPASENDDNGVGKGFQEMLMRWSQINVRPEIPGKFEYSMEKIRRLHMDETETLLIKSLLLFNPDTEGLVDASQVQVTQNKCHRALEEHAVSINPEQRDRSGRILLTILTLSSFEERDIESIFLSSVLGNATVTSLMENLLCADAIQRSQQLGYH